MSADLLTDPKLFLAVSGFLLVLALAMKNMLPLRVFALLAAMFFAAYAFLQSDVLLIVMGIFTLIIGVYRLFEVQNTSRKIRRTRHYGYKIENLLPIMEEM